MNYYYLVFIILLILSGIFFSNVVNKIAGFATSTLGIVALLAYLYYVYYPTTQYVTEWPSESYLRNLGLQCPSSTWRVEAMSRQGKDPTVTCVYSGPQIELRNCTDPGSANKKTFSIANVTYPPVMSTDRKQWLENCKYVKNGVQITPPWVEYDLS